MKERQINTLPENEYPYPIHEWGNEKEYLSPHDYFERPDKYIHIFFKENKIYQSSLKSYLNREYLGDSYSPFFIFILEPLCAQPLYRLLEGDSCKVCHDIFIYWGWQFLRRNHAYQYAFDRYMNNEKFTAEGLKIENKNTRGFIDGECTILNEAHIVNSDGSRRLLIHYIADFFGVRIYKWGLPDPRDNSPHHSHFWILNPGVATSSFDNEVECQRALHPRFEDEIIFRVNTRLPLPAQIQHIKNCMKANAKRMNHKNKQRPNNTEFKRLIRVLDAIRSGVGKDVIASEIYPYSENSYNNGGQKSGDKAVNEAINSGLELTRNEYMRYFYAKEHFV